MTFEDNHKERVKEIRDGGKYHATVSELLQGVHFVAISFGDLKNNVQLLPLCAHPASRAIYHLPYALPQGESPSEGHNYDRRISKTSSYVPPRDC